MQVKEIVKKAPNRMPAEQYEQLIKKTRKEHDKMVKGMFEFVDAQGGWLEFCYRFFKGEPLMTIKLVHGEICELPMGIVKHLNNTYKKVRVFDQNPDKNDIRGLPKSYSKQSRVRFTPIDWIDDKLDQNGLMAKPI